MAVAAEPMSKPFTVQDSIEMTRVVEPQPLLGRRAPAVLKVSPDQTHVLTVVYQGNLASGRNEYRLLCFDIADAARFLTSSTPRPLPAPRILASFAIAPEHDMSDRAAIEQAQWVNNDTVSFIGRNAAGIGQVYAVSVSTGVSQQLTQHPDDVATYAVSDDLQRVVYGAYTPPDWRLRNIHGYAYEPVNDYPVYLMNSKDPNDQASKLNVQFFLKSAASDAAAPLRLTAIGVVPPHMSLDPSARRVVVPVPLRSLPARWAGYEFVKSDPAFVQATGATVEYREAFSGPTQVSQYHLLDVDTGLAVPLLDAPARIAGDGRMQAQWSPDSRYVALPPMYLPLEPSIDDAERIRRSREQSLVLFDVQAGRVQGTVERVKLHKVLGRLTLTDFWWTKDGQLLVQYCEASDEARELLVRYRLDAARIARVRESMGRCPPTTGVATAKVELFLKQSLNSAPEIAVRDLGSRRERTFTKLNPQLASESWGHAEPFSWTDRHGRTFTGGLVFPVGYRAGQRYPIVLQTGGYYDEHFLLEGAPGISPTAARALASQQIMVLQLPDERTRSSERPSDNSKFSFEDDGETPRFQAEIEGAIDTLDMQGLIDRNRVGLIGFSRLGMRIHYALTFSSYPIAAATVADSTCLSPNCYADWYGSPYPGMATWDMEIPNYTTIGSEFWQAGIQRWQERSYLFHLDCVRTPIRYESYGPRRPSQWENFVILKRHEFPTEMYIIPTASHVLTAPFAVYASKQGNVDWFSFWLKGEEIDREHKQAQYDRWERLRTQQARLSETTQDHVSEQCGRHG